MASVDGSTVSKENTSSNKAKNTPASRGFLEWIHCNRCYEIYVKKRRKFYLLAGCHHVTCDQCTPLIQQTATNGPPCYKCPLCMKAVRACQLDNSMPAHLKELFHPEPYKEGLNNFQILRFQVKHHERFLGYIDRMRRSQDEIRNNIDRYRTLSKKIYQDLLQAKLRRKHMEKRVLLVKRRQKEIETKRQQEQQQQQHQRKVLEEQRLQLEKYKSAQASQAIADCLSNGSEKKLPSNFSRNTSMNEGSLNSSNISSFMQPIIPHFTL